MQGQPLTLNQGISILAERALMAALPNAVHEETKQILAACLEATTPKPVEPQAPDNIEQFPPSATSTS